MLLDLKSGTNCTPVLPTRGLSESSSILATTKGLRSAPSRWLSSPFCVQTPCRTAEDFQNVSEEIGQRFGTAAGQTDIQERGNYANQNSVQEELCINTPPDPKREQKTGDQGCRWRHVEQGVLAVYQQDRNDNGKNREFCQKSADQNAYPMNSRGGTHSRSLS